MTSLFHGAAAGRSAVWLLLRDAAWRWVCSGVVVSSALLYAHGQVPKRFSKTNKKKATNNNKNEELGKYSSDTY